MPLKRIRADSGPSWRRGRALRRRLETRQGVPRARMTDFGKTMLTHPQFDPVALQIGPLALRWYGLMYLAAFTLFFLLGR